MQHVPRPLRRSANRNLIETLALILLKPTFAVLLFAWGVLVYRGDICGSFMSLAVIGLLFYFVVSHSGRLRGKRAEGGP